MRVYDRVNACVLRICARACVVAAAAAAAAVVVVVAVG